MTDDQELIARLRDAVSGEHDMTPHGADVLQAADRIEALTEQLAAAQQDANEAEAYAEELEAMNKNQEAMIRQADRRGDDLEGKLTLMMTERDEAWKRAAHAEKMWGEAEVKLAKAVEALRNLHGAVCGETGFAAAVRAESGKAYPWPWLDQADADAIATLAEIKGESHE